MRKEGKSEEGRREKERERKGRARRGGGRERKWRSLRDEKTSREGFSEPTNQTLSQQKKRKPAFRLLRNLKIKCGGTNEFAPKKGISSLAALLHVLDHLVFCASPADMFTFHYCMKMPEYTYPERATVDHAIAPVLTVVNVMEAACYAVIFRER